MNHATNFFRVASLFGLIAVVSVAWISAGLAGNEFAANHPENEESQQAITQRGQDDDKTKKSTKSMEEQESVVLEFLKQHHEELLRIVKKLKQKDAQQYNKAMRELYAVTERLSRLQQRDSERYELELKVWQAKSRGELLAAQLQMKDSVATREQLAVVLKDRKELALKLMQLEYDRLSARRSKLEASILKLQSQDEKVEERIEQIVQAGKKSGAKKNGNSVKPAVNGKVEAKNDALEPATRKPLPSKTN
jgi:hypothetical protein